MTQAEYQVLLNQIPSLPDLQSAWSLLLHCASARANYFLRVVPPELGEEFARAHDSSLWACLCTMMGISEVDCEATAREAASLPLALGASVSEAPAERTLWRTGPAGLTRFTWCRSAIQVLQSPPHPLGGRSNGTKLDISQPPGLLMVSMGLKFLHGEVWLARLFVTLKTMSREVPDRGGNMRVLRESSKISERLISSRESQTPRRPCCDRRVVQERARSCPQLLLLSTRICRCGRTFDPHGHHRAACARSGALAHRGFAVESAVARVCREGGGRVATNRMIRDLDLAIPSAGDSRRIEVIVDGLSLFGGAQLAVDATMVSPVRADGLPREGAAAGDGVALTTARQRKQRTYPELSGHQHWCRLVVLATEVGGRWSLETRDYLRALAGDPARSEPPLLRKSGTSMAVAVVVHPVVHSCSSSGSVIGGQVGCWG